MPYTTQAQRYGIDAGGRSGRGILALTDDGGAYPPRDDWAPTLAQSQDIMNACAASAASGRPEPLALPFEYRGPAVGWLRTGDIIDAIYNWDGECQARGSYERICAALAADGRSDPHCEHARPKIPTWVWWLGGLAVVGGGAYLATR